jgi:5'(3')-deoxyribonucleotidase
MNKMIKIDIDDTILDLLNLTLKTIKERENKIINPKNINYWDYYKDKHPYILKTFNDPKTYENIKPIKGSEEFLKKIINEYGIENIEFVTSSPENVLEAKDKAMRKLFKNIKDFETIPIIHVGTTEKEDGLSHNKNYYYINSIVLEDGEHNVELLLEEDPEANVMLIDFAKYGWNQNLKENKEKYPNFKRISSYEEALEYIKENYPKRKEKEIGMISF